jgi:hypothetical protein
VCDAAVPPAVVRSELDYGAAARHVGFPTRDLVRTVAADVDNDDLVVLVAHPHALPDVCVWHGVLATLELNDRHVLARASCDAESRSERLRGQRVESLLFLDQPLDRRAARRSMGSGIDPLTPVLARDAQLSEARAAGEQIGLSRHQVS